MISWLRPLSEMAVVTTELFGASQLPLLGFARISGASEANSLSHSSTHLTAMAFGIHCIV